jgi:hypothetical protein
LDASPERDGSPYPYTGMQALKGMAALIHTMGWQPRIALNTQIILTFNKMFFGLLLFCIFRIPYF